MSAGRPHDRLPGPAISGPIAAKYKRMAADRCRPATGSPRGLPPSRLGSGRPIPAARRARDGVVIVGAGLTGCATAVACALAGMKPIVIEADRVGLVAGRAAGLLLPDPGPSFRDIAKRARPARGQDSSSDRGGGRRSTRRLSCGGSRFRAASSRASSLIVGPQDDEQGAAARVRRARGGRRGRCRGSPRRQITALTPLDVAGGHAGARRLPARSVSRLPRAGRRGRGQARRDVLRADAREEGPGRPPQRRGRSWTAGSSRPAR